MTDDKPPRPSAGLPLSVGSASMPVRIAIAVVFFLVGAISIAGGLVVSRTGPAASVVAELAIVPLGLIACVAALYVLAPFSRFGVWLDAYLGALDGVRVTATLVVLWTVSTIVVTAAG